MRSLHLRLSLSPQECLALYSSAGQNVKTNTVDGRSVVFPTRVLRTLVRHNGIQGLFRLNYSASGKFISIERVAS